MQSIGEILLLQYKVGEGIAYKIGHHGNMKWVIRVDYKCNMMEAQELQGLCLSKWKYD